MKTIKNESHKDWWIEVDKFDGKFYINGDNDPKWICPMQGFDSLEAAEQAAIESKKAACGRE